MAVNEAQLNDVGTIFEVTIVDGGKVVDVSGAAVKEIVFKAPSASSVTKAAAFKSDGSDGVVQYVIAAGDLDEAGFWQIQARVVLATGDWRSAVAGFFVRANL